MPLPDGRILVSGFFIDFGGTTRQGLVRLLANGALDSSFASDFPAPFSAKPLVQPDGKIIVAGSGLQFVGVARLNPDGTFDNAFNPDGFESNADIRGVALQTDGIVLAGFTVF